MAKDPVTFEAAQAAIISAGRILDGQGWAPATSGNYSMRLDNGGIAITVSGRHKGRLTPDCIMRLDAEGRPLDAQRPSAETALHVGLYRLMPHVKAVLHTHSIPAVALSRLMPQAGHLHLQGYEMLKAYPGVNTHETQIDLPMFDNSQDMIALQAMVDRALETAPMTPAYVIRNHGVYGWGRDMAEALRVIEATEYLLHCELAMRRAA